MMSVLEYANDINKDLKEVLTTCSILKMDYITDGKNMLNDEDIIELDNYFANENEIEDVEIDKVVRKKKKEVEEKIDKKNLYKNKEKLQSNAAIDEERFVIFRDGMSVKEFSENLNIPVTEIIKKLFSLGIMVTINSTIDREAAEFVAVDYNKEIKKEESLDVSNFEEFEIIDNPEDLLERPPVVTIMGHVDHGKTTLLDAIRKSKTAEQEVGGITQSISAYQAKYKDKKITFIDTPGHAAFTQMRSRGAKITDIVIIIVAADDGIMPQTKEAIDHAKAADVPIMVAINKIDKEGSNPDRVMTELSDYGLMPDVWGGDTLYSNVSALNGDGIDELLDNVLLLAEMNPFKANPNRYAIGTVVEAELDKKVGPVATVLVQSGTLRIGDPVVVGTSYGKIRTIKNDVGTEIVEAGPSMPVAITGLNETPASGDKFMAFEKEKEARSIWQERKIKCKDNMCEPQTAITLDDVFSKIKEGKKEINVLVKADVQGSAEAVKSVLEKIEVEGVHIKVLRSSVGAITESDVILAKASGAIVIGFNVRPNNEIKTLARENNVDIRFHNIIYKAVEEIEAAMKGMLDPEFEEKILGTAEVRQLFKFSKVGVIAGSYIIEGVVKSNGSCRIIRDGIVIYEGEVKSIQREKDQVKEVKKGFECGITIEGYNDIKENDLIEVYEMVEIKK